MKITKAILLSAVLATTLLANQTDKEGDELLVLKANHIKKIEFSGTHYFGYSSITPRKETDDNAASAGFESRRNYIQMKSYFNDKDYFRVTLDARKELASGNNEKIDGYNQTYIKYAYLWLENMLPNTGAEIGIAHRPWIDYEEHNSWLWRSISKAAIEDHHSSVANKPDLVNSSDFGFNLKTKTPYFSSEIGFFNGEGYHADKKAAMQKNSTDLSFEGRLTYNLLGNGDKKLKPKKDTYLNISTAWLMSSNHKDNNITVGDTDEYDRTWNTLHVVYNQPEFLISAQYTINKDSYKDSAKDYKGTVMSVNADYRVGDYTIIARYDDSYWEKDGKKQKDKGGNVTIAGIAYDYIDGVKLIANIKNYTNDQSGDTGKKLSYDSFMLTTEVHW